MTKKELVKNAYEQFYEYVENSVDENGWVKREEHSGFMINHFYLSNNIKTKFIDKVEYWRPKTLKGIENNNGWILIRSEEDLPKDKNTQYSVCKCKKVFQSTVNCGTVRHWFNISKITHYQPITKPNAPLWTEEK